jgi:hypothetical protein
MALVSHDIWMNKEGLTMLVFSGDLGKEARALLEEGSELIHSFDANSHFDAMTIYYEFMGWGKYETEFEIDKVPYNLQELHGRR